MTTPGVGRAPQRPPDPIVDYVNLKRRDEGLPIREAAIEAAKLRLRPILMTTLTTVLGLLPLALGWGVGADLQAALARVVIGGLLASTLYLSANHGLERVRGTARRPGRESSLPEPAN